MKSKLCCIDEERLVDREDNWITRLRQIHWSIDWREIFQRHARQFPAAPGLKSNTSGRKPSRRTIVHYLRLGCQNEIFVARMPLIQWFLYWTRYSWHWTVQWNPIYISINLILPLACWLDFADSCAICRDKTSQKASNNDLNNVLRLRTASPRERRCFEASAYSEGGLGSDQRIELRISTETPLDIPLPPPNYIQKVRNKLAHRSVFGQIWVVGKISRSCCKGVDCAGFERLLCARARRLCLVDDKRCTLSSASIQTKWNVTVPCPKFIWHSMTGPPCGSQRSNVIPFTFYNGEQSWLR